MVNLTKIYTRTGDGGRTRLGDGSDVAKHDARIEAYGTVDELNAAIGLALCDVEDEQVRSQCRQIQSELFDLGADLCRPVTQSEQPGDSLRLPMARAQRLEGWIDQWNAGLDDLRSFILPAGTRAAAALHVARTICRRAERRVVALRDGGGQVSEPVVVYLNRLSDLLFVLARVTNRVAGGDVLWEPGAE